MEGDDGRRVGLRELEVLMKNCWCGSTRVKPWMTVRWWSNNDAMKSLSLTWNLYLAPHLKLKCQLSSLISCFVTVSTCSKQILSSYALNLFSSCSFPIHLGKWHHCHPSSVKAAVWVSFHILPFHPLSYCFQFPLLQLS